LAGKPRALKRGEAPGPASPKARKSGRDDRFAGQIAAEANPEVSIMQALAVYDGGRCIGFLMARGKQGVEGFNIDTKSLGIFPDQKAAANMVREAAITREEQ
jgi:hypothetical protein